MLSLNWIVILIQEAQSPFTFHVYHNLWYHRKALTATLAIFSRVLLVFIQILSVFVCFCYCSSDLHQGVLKIQWSFESLVITAAIIRLFRECFSRPANIAIELCLCWGLASTSSSIIFRLVFAAFLRSRLQDAWLKLQFIIISISSLRKRKTYRFRGWLIASLLCLPISLGSFILSVMLDAPLVPICGTTIYILGFPRPHRFCPKLTASAASSDAAYYQQLLPQLIRQLPKRLSFRNFISSSVCNSYVFLFRLEKQLVVFRVLRTGLSQFHCQIKGLELQEPTSCHNKEASNIDDVFGTLDSSEERKFETAASEKLTWNPYFMHVLRPMDKMMVEAYSISETTLIGILDTPSSLVLIAKTFWYTLIWKMQQNNSNLKTKGECPKLSKQTMEHMAEQLPQRWLLAVQAAKFTDDSVPAAAMSDATPTSTPAEENSLPYNGDIQAAMKANDRGAIRQIMQARSAAPKRASESSPIEVGDGKDSKGKQEDQWDIPSPKKQVGEQLTDFWDDMSDLETSPKKPQEQPSSGIPLSKKSTPERPADDLENFWDDLCDFEDSSPPKKAAAPKPFAENVEKSWKAVAPSSEPPTRVSTTRSTINDDHISSTRSSTEEKQATALDAFPQLICNCYAITQYLGLGCKDASKVGGISHVMKCFQGKFPPCIELDWLDKNKALRQLVVEAYRLAVVMALEHIVLGDESFLDQFKALNEELLVCERDCYIGVRNTKDWKQNITSERPKLFALYEDSNGFARSCVLSLRRQRVNIGIVNEPACISTWASLAMELLYMTNDDDERYSIQANTMTLRNLVVQSADVPLGYPVFTSCPIQVLY